MGKQRIVKTRVRDLAKTQEMDVDELLVELWDHGIETVNGPADFV